MKLNQHDMTRFKCSEVCPPEPGDYLGYEEDDPDDQYPVTWAQAGEWAVPSPGLRSIHFATQANFAFILANAIERGADLDLDQARIEGWVL